MSNQTIQAVLTLKDTQAFHEETGVPVETLDALNGVESTYTLSQHTHKSDFPVYVNDAYLFELNGITLVEVTEESE